jgi:hypothetical protein
LSEVIFDLHLQADRTAGIAVTPSTTPAPGSPQPDFDSVGGSYFTRKQDETQTALLKIMEDERTNLITRMVETFDNNNRDGQSLIYATESEMLLRGIEHCVKNDEAVGRTVAKILIEELKAGMKDSAEYNRLLKQLQLFLFLLKREIQDVLRTRSIKPHWMFAFDDMISKAVQIILQQMGIAFLGDDMEPDRREYTSQTSTSVNSASNHTYDTASTRLVRVQDNSALLMEQLIEAEIRYQDLLKKNLHDKCNLIRLLEAQMMGSDTAKD